MPEICVLCEILCVFVVKCFGNDLRAKLGNSPEPRKCLPLIIQHAGLMADQEPQQNLHNSNHRGRTGLKIMMVLLFLLVAAAMGIFLGFNYFGERFLRKYLQEKINRSSNGLYRADFKTLHLNILTGKIVIDSFDLIPDTMQYQRLKAQGRVARSLYRIFFSSLTIDRVHFRQIYEGKRINFRQLIVERPLLSIVGFPDTVTASHSKWRVIYEDLYPAVSGFFNDFHIDSVKVRHGLLLAKFGERKGSMTTGAYEFSSVLKDVSVNPFSYYNRDRVFYSRDVDLIIHNFESQLADSLYLLKAEEVGFSLTKSILYGKKASLVPNFNSKRIREVHSGDLFRIDLPAFSIRGVDLYKAMTGRQVEISSVDLSDFFVRIYRNKPSPGVVITKKARKKITLAGLYSVVAKELRFLAIDSLNLKNGALEFYGNISDRTPEMRIGKVNLELNQFRLDSVSHLDQSRIFYSRAIELDLEQFSLVLRDGIHYIDASAVRVSTQESLIDVRDARIFPDRRKNLLQAGNRKNTMLVSVPRLTFSGIDLKKVFNRRILDFERLIIQEPEVFYTRLRQSKNPDPRFKTAEDFFETENEDVVYDLLKKYLWVVKGKAIDVLQGQLKISVGQNDTEIPIATTSFDLSMEQFLIDSVHGMNEQGYFYSREFTLNLQSVSIVSPDSLKNLRADRIHIATPDSLIEADNIEIYKSSGPFVFNSRIKRKQSMAFEFSLQKLRLTGLNHKKLFLEKILRANEIVLENPTLFLKTNNSLRPAGPPEEAQLIRTSKFAHTFEIGRFQVRKGTLSYDGEEDRKSSFFSLKDIDFEVTDAIVHLPDKGNHDGLIKFDSLQLKVFPLRGVIADSAYALEARSLQVHSYPADILVQGIKVTPLKSWDEAPGRKSMVSVTIPEIRLHGFFFDRAIFDNVWMLDSMAVDHPQVVVEIGQDTAKLNKSGVPVPSGYIRMPPFMKTADVKKVSISDATAGLIVHKPGKSQSYSLKDFILEIDHFRVDSATRANPLAAPLFNSDNITFSSPGFSWSSPDSMYRYSIGRFGFSTASAGGFLDSVVVTPNFSRTDFSRISVCQADRIDMQVPGITISKVDLRKLIFQRQLVAASLRADGLIMHDYLDKRVPFDSTRRPLMPGQMIMQVKYPINIDTIAVSNGFVSYEEQTADEPGRVFFDKVNATLTGFSTLTGSTTLTGYPGEVELHGTMSLMGKAPAEAWFHFLTTHPRDSFTFHARIGELDLTAINPMLSKLVPASIKHGTATSTEIGQVNGNNIQAIGRMNFRYENLDVKIHPKQPGTWKSLEQSVMTGLANLFLADNNPNDDGKMKQGIIYFERDPSKGFFNFVWKSILSGLKSSVGVNSKTQKKINKQVNSQRK